jgi:hypothetical protein
MSVFNVDPASGCWNYMEVGCVADVSEEHTASRIRSVEQSVQEWWFKKGSEMDQATGICTIQCLWLASPCDLIHLWSLCKRLLSNSPHFSPDEGSSMLLWNVGNIAHFYTEPATRRRININNKS